MITVTLEDSLVNREKVSRFISKNFDILKLGIPYARSKGTTFANADDEVIYTEGITLTRKGEIELEEKFSGCSPDEVLTEVVNFIIQLLVLAQEAIERPIEFTLVIP